MAFSVKLILFNHKEKDNTFPIAIRTIINRKITYKMTGYWASKSQFIDGKLNNTYPDHNTVNRALTQLLAEQERKLTLIIAQGETLEIETIKPKIEKQISIEDFVKKLREDLKGKFSEGILKHYSSAVKKMIEYDPKIKFSRISAEWLNGLEKSLRETKYSDGTTMSGNTIQNNMKIIKSILNKAWEQGIIKKEQFERYKRPKYTQPIPVYLTEDEIKLIEKNVATLGTGGKKTSGYYFLLSCYTGYRISDARQFHFDTHVQDGKIILRAKKNNQIVSIPIHSRLMTILEFVRETPFDISEQKARDYVKAICKDVGIKKDVKYHTSRHSFAMLLMAKGFSIDEVASLLGDTPEVARIYARVSNIQLGDKIMDRFN